MMPLSGALATLRSATHLCLLALMVSICGKMWCNNCTTFRITLPDVVAYTDHQTDIVAQRLLVCLMGSVCCGKWQRGSEHTLTFARFRMQHVAQAWSVYAASRGKLNPDCKMIGSCVSKAAKAWPGCMCCATSPWLLIWLRWVLLLSDSSAVQRSRCIL